MRRSSARARAQGQLALRRRLPEPGPDRDAGRRPAAPPEFSIYVGENHWKHAIRLRRHTLRIDGFVSLHARRKAGELVTKPFVFAGQEADAERRDLGGGHPPRRTPGPGAAQPFPGFTLADCDEIFGDTLDRT